MRARVLPAAVVIGGLVWGLGAVSGAAPAAAQSDGQFGGQSGGQSGDDRHIGYYYPEPATTEVYEARAYTLPQASRKMRIAFVTGITNEQNKAPYPPTAAIFAKGSEAEKLIIVALQDGRIDTLYRARAIFAQMTAVARLMPAFTELGVDDYYTFFDLVKMLGFEQITVSNGREFAHQILIQ